ncbi:hypothetical protein PHYBLDRAFT_62925 [Phycomyces blakesleeanus NRRL 1555(-)]|uniref:Uncharacterized protein n=1 Tax=Phycomyces blakesleeanus (strain ATCC 8743b / DSM 1359 / FGSC 10004 / NBRC 33097 / NRRL 1555) TaxID=763407 RepID=A0A162XWI3_PHYB8|nr:hypothetical protein PHYBLDRAFT_62925 [Phycomyces blakesleeanus NRRL 1555(-)]OAD76885.1 hypothetical protein PHYBLDRAFT_62925 [Phycomyces blakesleeanus NRRL 1555(-)]|eukprot:XP_018294925.1 hypothetical protein PHYBLDRAFT_62925 [Phycomyces blakesleeanus NRRL 1555(-)]
MQDETIQCSGLIKHSYIMSGPSERTKEATVASANFLQFSAENCQVSNSSPYLNLSKNITKKPLMIQAMLPFDILQTVSMENKQHGKAYRYNKRVKANSCVTRIM